MIYASTTINFFDADISTRTLKLGILCSIFARISTKLACPASLSDLCHIYCFSNLRTVEVFRVGKVEDWTFLFIRFVDCRLSQLIQFEYRSSQFIHSLLHNIELTRMNQQGTLQMVELHASA